MYNFFQLLWSYYNPFGTTTIKIDVQGLLPFVFRQRAFENFLMDFTMRRTKNCPQKRVLMRKKPALSLKVANSALS